MGYGGNQRPATLPASHRPTNTPASFLSFLSRAPGHGHGPRFAPATRARRRRRCWQTDHGLGPTRSGAAVGSPFGRGCTQRLLVVSLRLLTPHFDYPFGHFEVRVVLRKHASFPVVVTQMGYGGNECPATLPASHHPTNTPATLSVLSVARPRFDARRPQHKPPRAGPHDGDRRAPEHCPLRSCNRGQAFRRRPAQTSWGARSCQRDARPPLAAATYFWLR